ncbi:MAG: thermosome subunit beta [Candidatus Thermoplasmatota archaeon]|nr:thermosome subunit beta [Candidatus Thermoplasmatota archaeon]
MMAGQQPIIVLKEGTTREKGKGARSNNINAAVAIADAVKSTLGPKGMDKMLVDSMGDVIISNDGATLLKEMDIEHPAAKMILEVAKSQDEQCGDGTTSAVILTGELLKTANLLLDKHIHPTIMTSGYKHAANKAIEILRKSASPLRASDKEMLQKIAMTAMASKGASGSKEFLAKIVVDAVTSIADKHGENTFIDLDNVQIQKQQGGNIEDTEIIKGIILDKERAHEGMPEMVTKAKIALVNTALEVRKTEVDARIQIQDPSQLQAFLNEEESMIRKMVEKVRASGATVLLCQKGIDDLALHFLGKHGVYAIKQVKESDIKKIAKATGARIVSDLSDLQKEDLGYAGNIQQKKYADDTYTFIQECKNPKAVSILLRGGTEHVVDELERGIHDSLSVVKVALQDGKMVVGGGASAMEIAMALRAYAPNVGGREQMAIEAFADAMEIIPKTLAQNAGFDAIDIILELRRQHKKGNKNAGINVFTGKVEDMMKNNVIEPLSVGLQEIQAASEASMMILRIDDVIASKSGGSSASPPGGYGGMDDY